MKTLTKIILIFLASTVVSVNAQVIESKESGWPQWRGKTRNSISQETGLLKSWPKNGPKLVSSITGIGNGYSSPIIVNDVVYITGDKGDDLIVSAHKTDGTKLWEVKNGRP